MMLVIWNYVIPPVIGAVIAVASYHLGRSDERKRWRGR